MFFVAFSPSGNGGTGVGGGAQEGRFEVVAHVAAHVPARPVLVYQAIDRSFQQIDTWYNTKLINFTSLSQASIVITIIGFF